MVAPARDSYRHNKIVKRHDFDHRPSLFRDGRADGPQHRSALFGGKQRGLAGMNANGNHEPVTQPAGVAQNIEMAIGDGIKRTRVNGRARDAANGWCVAPFSVPQECFAPCVPFQILA